VSVGGKVSAIDPSQDPNILSGDIFTGSRIPLIWPCKRVLSACCKRRDSIRSSVACCSVCLGRDFPLGRIAGRCCGCCVCCRASMSASVSWVSSRDVPGSGSGCSSCSLAESTWLVVGSGCELATLDFNCNDTNR